MLREVRFVMWFCNSHCFDFFSEYTSGKSIYETIFDFFQTLKWRSRLGVDDIDKWQAPKVLVDYSPHGLSGFDKEGSPG